MLSKKIDSLGYNEQKLIFLAAILVLRGNNS